jgi:hypothetical protein
VSNSHKVTTTLIVMLPFQIVVCGERFLCNFMDISCLVFVMKEQSLLVAAV